MSNFLTMKYHYKASSKEKQLLKLLCRISKNIYNSALYPYLLNTNLCGLTAYTFVFSNSTI